MSTGANLTAWFSALIVTLTGSDNQVGGMWSHPGFFYPAEQIEARKQARGEGAAAPSMHVRFLPGSNVRPDVKAVIGPGGGPEWPCAVLPLEIEAGNIRAFRPADYPEKKPLVPHGMSTALGAPASFRYTASAKPQRHREVGRVERQLGGVKRTAIVGARLLAARHDEQQPLGRRDFAHPREHRA